MALGLFEQIAAINTRLKRLCCKIESCCNSTNQPLVYTALLTQTGGDDSQTIDTGLLTVGVTYRINNDSPGMDFTNVGAPTNTLYSSFVASGTTPNSWGANEGGSNATLTYNNGAPVVTVLENTIGNITWTYSTTGVYFGTLTGAFPLEKTALFIGNNRYNDANVTYISNTGDDNRIVVESYEATNTTHTDTILGYTTIQIKVYS